MPDGVTIHIPSFPRCPDCGAEAHELTFSPAVDSEETRALSQRSVFAVVDLQARREVQP